MFELHIALSEKCVDGLFLKVEQSTELTESPMPTRLQLSVVTIFIEIKVVCLL